MKEPKSILALTILFGVNLALVALAAAQGNSTTTPSYYNRAKGWVQENGGRTVIKKGVQEAVKGFGKRASFGTGEVYEWVVPKKAYAPTIDGEPFASQRRRQQEREQQYRDYQERQRRYWDQVQRGIAEDRRRREQQLRNAYQRLQQQQSQAQYPQQLAPGPRYEWRWVNGQLRQVRVR